MGFLGQVAGKWEPFIGDKAQRGTSLDLAFSLVASTRKSTGEPRDTTMEFGQFL